MAAHTSSVNVAAISIPCISRRSIIMVSPYQHGTAARSSFYCRDRGSSQPHRDCRTPPQTCNRACRLSTPMSHVRSVRATAPRRRLYQSHSHRFRLPFGGVRTELTRLDSSSTVFLQNNRQLFIIDLDGLSRLSDGLGVGR